MKVTLDKIRALIQPIFDREHIYLVDLELRGNRGSRVLSVYADTKQGITLEEITRLTREINDLLDMHDVIEGAYRLDVSSPGVDRSLTHLWEFEKNIGRNLQVVFEEDGEQQELSGKLIAADQERIHLQTNKEKMTIPMAAVKKARVQLKW